MSSPVGIGSGTSALQYAQLGVSRGVANVARDAQIVAGSVAGGGDPTDALLDAKRQVLDVEASARAFSIADETLGTLIDIKA